MLKEFIEYGNNIKEEMKVTLGEIKKSLQGTNNEEEEARIQINDWEHKEEISIQTTARRNKNSKKKKMRIV